MRAPELSHQLSEGTGPKSPAKGLEAGMGCSRREAEQADLRQGLCPSLKISHHQPLLSTHTSLSIRVLLARPVFSVSLSKPKTLP